MTQSDLNDLMENTIFPRLRELGGAGQAEYARVEGNAFANFDRVAEAVGITREKALQVYGMKHDDGINSWINGHKSQREDVRGRIADRILYYILLWGMVEDAEPHPETVAIVDAPGGRSSKRVWRE